MRNLANAIALEVHYQDAVAYDSSQGRVPLIRRAWLDAIGIERQAAINS
jgi:hypothetical protein